MSVWLVEGFVKTFKNKTVLELGSGPGLCGLIAACEAKMVVLTDYQELVMDLIDKNMQSCNPKPKKCKMFASMLDWDKMDDPVFFDNLEYTNTDQTVEGKFSSIKFDYIIGSDIVYWPQSI
jgi:predicted nicotinamide N-methyase